MKYIPLDGEAREVGTLAVGQMFALLGTAEVVFMRVQRQDMMTNTGAPKVTALPLACSGAWPDGHPRAGYVCEVDRVESCRVVNATLYEDSI